MKKYQNHVIDPTFFYDVIEEFSFDYDIYVLEENDEPDEYGRIINKYNKDIIRGSLQTQGITEIQSKDGNKQDLTYDFYCKSLYKINIGDIIEYEGNFLRVNFVKNYDEYGVREARLKMINLAAYRDFADYIKYLKGEKIV